MKARSWTLGSVSGIDIRVHVSWVLIAALVTGNFWARFSTVEDEPGGIALLMALSAAALFFGSVLAHELAHSLEAKRRGVEVHGITLFLFGGVTETRFDVRRPFDEFALTAIGPFTSFVAAAALGLTSIGAGSAGLDRIAAVTGLLAWLNLALGLFNLLPGAPLDGGRILRSIVWWRTGDRDRAVRVAARTGQALGGALIGLGAVQFLAVRGAGVGGLWLAFIGWFLMRAAQAELERNVLHHVLEDVPVGRVVGDSAAIPAEVTVEEAVERWFKSHDAEAFAVVRDGRPVGTVGIGEVGAIGQDDRSDVRVAEVMKDIDDVPVVQVDQSGEVLLERLETDPVAIVLDGDRVVGVVTARRLASYGGRARALDA